MFLNGCGQLLLRMVKNQRISFIDLYQFKERTHLSVFSRQAIWAPFFDTHSFLVSILAQMGEKSSCGRKSND